MTSFVASPPPWLTRVWQQPTPWQPCACWHTCSLTPQVRGIAAELVACRPVGAPATCHREHVPLPA